MEVKKTPEALSHFREALRLAPYRFEAYNSTLWLSPLQLPFTTHILAFHSLLRLPALDFEFKTGLEFLNTWKDLELFFKNEKKPWKVWHFAGADKTSDGSGLKVDGNPIWLLLVAEEPTTFVVHYIDRLWIKSLELALVSCTKKPWNVLNCVGQHGAELCWLAAVLRKIETECGLQSSACDSFGSLNLININPLLGALVVTSATLYIIILLLLSHWL